MPPLPASATRSLFRPDAISCYGSPCGELDEVSLLLPALSADLLVVDETHRLNQRANQPAAALNIKFRDIKTKLFGHDDTSKTQLDWIMAKSTHQIFLADPAHSEKPADIAIEA